MHNFPKHRSSLNHILFHNFQPEPDYKDYQNQKYIKCCYINKVINLEIKEENAKICSTQA